MLGTRGFVATLVLLGALAIGGTATAAPPQAVTLSVFTDFNRSSDPFTSTGGIVCASGTVSTPFALFVGGQSTTHAQLLVGKHFVCSAGTFDVLLRVTLRFDTGGTAGTWSVAHGTGAYAALHGTGKIIGTAGGGGIQDEYTGAMHID